MKKCFSSNNTLLWVLFVFCMLMTRTLSSAADYVFMNGNYFLGQTTTATTDFVPNASIYTGASGSTFRNANDYYIRYNTTRLEFSTTNSSNFTLDNNQLTYTGFLGTYYLNLNNTTWRITNNNNRATAYTVAKRSISAGTYSDFSVTGGDYISSVGGYNYAHTNAIVDAACTEYTFNGRTYYSTNDAQAASTTQPTTEVTTGYVWSLNDNPYATVNATTGRITVNSLPTGDVDLTLTCTLNGTKSASKTVTLTKTPPVADGYVFYSGGNNGEYLANAAAGTTDFDPINCIWRRESDGSFTNGTYYLRDNDTFLSTYGNRSRTVTLGGTENGTTGQTLRFASNGRYLYYDSSTWSRNRNNASNVVFAVTKKTSTGTDNTTAPTISAAINSAKDGVQLSHTNVAGTYSPAYEDYIFYNNTPHYWYDGSSHDQKPSDVDFASANATYTWSIVSGDQYATIDASGNLKSKGVATTEQTVRVKLTTTHAASGYSNEQTYDVKIQDYAESPVVAKIGDNHVINNVGVSLTMRGYLEGSYKPAYAKYSFAYESHYLYNGKDYNYNEPALYNDGECVFTWSLSGEGKDYSSLNSNKGKNPVLTYNTSTDHDVVVTLHLTVTHPDFPSLRVESDAWDVTLYSPTVAAPVITYDERTSNVTLNVPSEGTTYYTTDGSDPKTSGTRQTYSAPFSITTSPTTIKAYSERWGVQSSVSEETIKLKLGKPTITVNDSGIATITLAGAPAGTEFRYTTDGSDPTETSPLYTTGLVVNNGVVVKAIAVNPDYMTSDIAEKAYSMQSGIVNGTVVLMDYEDHTWTYYSGVDAAVDGGKYKTDYQDIMYSPDPRNVKITYNGGGVSGASAVAISGEAGEDQNTMIYYKTIEKHQVGETGDYVYHVIPNPFSKRPRTTGSTGTNGYYGFGGWKLVSGGEYIQEYNNNDVLPLEPTIHFTGLPYPSVNCTSAEIVFEATWVPATVYVQGTKPNFTSGTYETNFWVLNANPGADVTLNQNMTFTQVTPDGGATADYRGTTMTRGILFSHGDGVTPKVEFMKRNSGTRFNPNGKNMFIGRGVTNQTTSSIYGSYSNTDVTNQVVRVESGNFGTAYHYNTSPSNVIKSIFIWGCDYDRAKGVNTNLTINEAMVDDNSDITSDESKYIAQIYVKSGRFAPNSTDSDGGSSLYYVGRKSATNNLKPKQGLRYMEIQGGELRNIAGASTDHQGQRETIAFRMRMKGGVIHGMAFGCARGNPSYGSRAFILTGGKCEGWLTPGSNGNNATLTGYLYGRTYLYAGGNFSVNSNGSTSKLNRSVGGNLFGSGCGYDSEKTIGGCELGSNTVVADNAYVERGVYAGGSFGYSDGISYIYITGGHVGGANGGISADGETYNPDIQGGVYGGSCQNKGNSANIIMTGGRVDTGIYGGSNRKGVMSGYTNILITGGTVNGNVHGGGYGENTVVNQNVDISIGLRNASTGAVSGDAVINGDVYGGSALGKVNGTTAADTYHTNVTLNSGIINGSLYGGALGDAGTAANVYGPVAVKVYGGMVNTTSEPGSGAVYGANNINGAPQRAVTVDIYGTDPAPSVDAYALDAVYGGGNQAAYTYGNGYPTVTVHGCDNSIEYVYGGGNAAAVAATDVTIWGGNKIGNVFGGGNGQVRAANVTGGTNVKIYGGTLGNVFGGSNANGAIDGNISVTVNDNGSSCGILIDNVFGGGNLAAYTGSPVVNILNGTLMGSVFGGGKGDPADHSKGKVTGNPQVTIGNATGTVEIAGDVYGGGDAGDVAGTPVVKIFKNCDNKIGNVYGGGNAADVTGTDVTVDGGTIGMVFGGGHGDKDADPQKEANVNGNVSLIITGGTIDKVFAGSNSKGNITGNTGVTVNKADGSCDLHITELYGGGNEAAGNAGTISIQNTGTASEGIGTVYGGANNADINSDIALRITGGNIGDIFGGNNNGGQVNGNITVDINWTGTGVNHVGNVYGGGNIASIDNGTSRTVTVNVTNATVSGSVFGGGKGKEAVIVGSTDVNIGSWTEGTVIIAGAGASAPGDVFGGGDMAAVEGACHVTVRDCNTLIAGDLYGGGNAAPVFETNTTMWGGTVAGNVFGGGNGQDAAKNANGAQVGYKRDDSTESGSGDATTYIYGGTVGTWNGDKCTEGTGGIFGGSNTNGNIAGNINLTVDEKTSSESGATKCTLKMKELYGAGNQAAYLGDGISFNLGCVDYLEEIYGGAKAADLNTNTILNITSGRFKRVFGGNNISGKLNGSITVNVDETGCNPVVIDELYGGGNLAAYSVYGYEGTAPRTKEQYDALTEEQKTAEGLTTPRTDPAVNIISCTRIDNVYGGGYGESAVMVGSPTVNINMIPGNYAVRIDSDGDGNADNNSGALGTVGTVFGGGNAAEVMGNTYVNVGTAAVKVKHMTGADQTTEYDAGANITGNVYGGGNQADVTGKTNVTVGHE